MGLFGKSKSAEEEAKEKVNELTTKLRKEDRDLNKQIRLIEREEQKTILSLKQAAKKNDKDVCKVLAKSLVQARKSKSRIYASKAHMNSIVLQMKTQLSQMKMAGSIQKSTEVMKSMQKLIRVPELQKAATELSKEMVKAGIIEEMINETIDGALDDEDTDDIADEEVEKVLMELTQGKLNDLPSIATNSLSTDNKIPVMGAQALASDDDEEEDDMTKRLESLRN
jgi:charged multivesicular body protein 3